jgi:L-lactate dehydrogenase complex protein LldG
MTTREAFLARIGSEVRRARAGVGVTPGLSPAPPAAAAEAVSRQLAERWPQALERFREEFERVAGVLHRAPTWGDVPAVVVGIARQRGVRDVVAWDRAALGADLAEPLGAAGLAVTAAGTADDAQARRRHREAAAAAGLGVTGVDLAIAETGTLVLRSGAGRPRATSLLPPTHVAVFDRRRLVESLEQLGIALEAWHADPDTWLPGAMINLITGPSRTADIELTLTRGVHGPKEVHAIFVESP